MRNSERGGSRFVRQADNGRSEERVSKSNSPDPTFLERLERSHPKKPTEPRWVLRENGRAATTRRATPNEIERALKGKK
ncbi:MAG: hypothetical protein GF381_01985 [Candidatus Pacebacteria bacterium]|nr:hypothetical protein [Candidatus Paceibacterota bacterium]